MLGGHGGVAGGHIGEVLEYRAPGQQAVFLKEKRSLCGVQAGDFPLLGLHQPAQHPQQGGLAAPGWTHQGGDPGPGDGEAHVIQGHLVPVSYREMFHLYHVAPSPLGFSHSPSSPSRTRERTTITAVQANSSGVSRACRAC